MRRRGQSLMEYAVLLAAVSLGVMVAAKVAHRAFTGHAQRIEQSQTVF